MADKLIQIADRFWNIRGSHKLAGLIDVGTQSSLVRLQRGDFVLLDSYTLSADVKQQVLALTDQGRAVRAVLNLHPFHTLHVSRIAQQFPNAQLYGTSRHKQQAAALPWQALTTDDPRLHELFANDFSFTVPPGVDLVPSSSRLHFASVLALHLPSSTLHVDDTLSWSSLPFVRGLSFHPTLRFALHKRAGAAAAFRAWAEQLVSKCDSVRHLCTAHARPLPDEARSVSEHVRAALSGVSKLLDAHARRYG